MGASYLTPDRVAANFNPQPKEDAWRSEKYRRLVASDPCEHCGYAGGQQAAHGDLGKGGAIKTDDRTCYSACVDRLTSSNKRALGCHTLISRQLAKEHRRALELRLACQTIHRRIQRGEWDQFKVALPDWYVEPRA